MKPSYDDRNITPSSWVSAKFVTARYGALRSSRDGGEMSRSREPSIRDAQQDGTPPTLKLGSGRWSYKQSTARVIAGRTADGHRREVSIRLLLLGIGTTVTSLLSAAPWIVSLPSIRSGSQHRRNLDRAQLFHDLPHSTSSS